MPFLAKINAILHALQPLKLHSSCQLHYVRLRYLRPLLEKLYFAQESDQLLKFIFGLAVERHLQRLLDPPDIGPVLVVLRVVLLDHQLGMRI